MRGILLPGDRTVSVSDFPDPVPGEGEVVVQMRAAAVCGVSAAADGPVPASASPFLSPPPTHDSIQDFIDNQKSSNVTMSKSQMTRICRDELKRHRRYGETTPPSADSPRN